MKFNFDFNFDFNPNKSEINKNIDLNQVFESPKIYKAIFDINKMAKFTIVEGGRASAKTQETALFLIKESFRFRDRVILCGREYQASIRDSVYTVIKKLIQAPKKNKIEDCFHITDKEIINLASGTRFVFRGFNDFKKGSFKKSSNLNKIKSLSSIIYVWIDESQDITSSTLDVLVPTGRDFVVTFFDHQDYQEEVQLDSDTKFIFTMNRQTNGDAVLHYFDTYETMVKKYKVNIFDLEPKFQNKSMLRLAEAQKSHPNYSHIWLGEAKIDIADSLFPQHCFKYDIINNYPDIAHVVIAVDPAGGSTLKNDETGVVVCGYSAELDKFLVLEDWSGRYSPQVWAKKVNALYQDYKASRVIVETNYGGDLVESNLRSINSYLPIYKVRAKKGGGKLTRAEPIATLFTENKVIFLQRMPELQNQLNGFTPSGYQLQGSPDRADALVYGLTYLVEKVQKKVTIHVLDF